MPINIKTGAAYVAHDAAVKQGGAYVPAVASIKMGGIYLPTGSMDAAEWILVDGQWNDLGAWKDASTWNDGA